MKAILINEYGDNNVVQLTDVERPKPQTGKVLIKVQTAGVNPIDWKIRSGTGERLGLKLPILLGGEIAETIKKIGDNVNSFNEGKRQHCFADRRISLKIM